MIGNKEPSTALVRMLLDLWIGLHVHLAACSDADKSCPPSLVSFSPAYTLPLFLLSPTQHTQEILCQQERQAQDGESHMLVSPLVSKVAALFFKKGLSWV